MNILELFNLWIEAAQKSLTDLATRRINASVDLFKAIKSAVELADANELTKGQKLGDFFKQVADTVEESIQKVNKLRNIAHMPVKEYKLAIEQTSAQMVLDLGQDSRIVDDITDYKVGFILRSVIGANRTSGYALKQSETEQFMTMLKASLKGADESIKRDGFTGKVETDYTYLARHFGSLTGICGALATGTLFDNVYFKAEKLNELWSVVEETPEETEPKEPKKETVDLDVHKKAINDNNEAHNEKNKELVDSNTTLQDKVKEQAADIANYIQKIADLQGRIKELETTVSIQHKQLVEAADRANKLHSVHA